MVTLKEGINYYAKRMVTSLNLKQERSETTSIASWRTLGSITPKGNLEGERRLLNNFNLKEASWLILHFCTLPSFLL